MGKEKIKDFTFEENLQKNEYYQNELEFNNSIKTNFFISLIFLIFECFIPLLLLWLLTGNDFSFSYKLKIYLIWIIAFSEVIFSLLLTVTFYLFKLHKVDQFTYVSALQFAMLSLYITSYLLPHHLIYRMLIAFMFILIGSLLGTVFSTVLHNIKLKKIEKKSEL